MKKKGIIYFIIISIFLLFITSCNNMNNDVINSSDPDQEVLNNIKEKFIKSDFESFPDDDVLDTLIVELSGTEDSIEFSLDPDEKYWKIWFFNDNKDNEAIVALTSPRPTGEYISLENIGYGYWLMESTEKYLSNTTYFLNLTSSKTPLSGTVMIKTSDNKF